MTLTPAKRSKWEALISQGKADTRTLAHARVLLQADVTDEASVWTD